MNYKEEYKKINRQIFELQQKKIDILAQAVESKGLKQGTKFKINDSWFYTDKLFTMVSNLDFKQLKKDGTINKAVNSDRLNFDTLDKVEIIED